MGAAFAVWTGVFFISGYVSLASISAAAVLPFVILALNCWAPEAVRPVPVPSFCFITVAAVLAIWKHRSNIVRLLNGTESSFKHRKKSCEEQEKAENIKGETR